MAFSFRRRAGVLMALSIPALHGTVANAADILGVWTTDDGNSAVEIQRCGDARCGRSVRLKQPLDDQGAPMRDANNPDLGSRHLPLCGAEVIHGVIRQSDDSWDGGSIYDPEDGKSYKVMLRADGTSLEVRGYLDTKASGETMIWTRVKAHLKRCLG